MLGENWARDHASHTGGEGKESIRMSIHHANSNEAECSYWKGKDRFFLHNTFFFFLEGDRVKFWEIEVEKHEEKKNDKFEVVADMKVWVKCDLKNIVGTLFNVVM